FNSGNPLTGKQPKRKTKTNEPSTTKGTLTVTLDKVVKDGVFDISLTAITTDKINCIDLGNFETFGNRVRDMAIDLLSKKDTNEYKTISKTLLTTIYGLMSKRKLTQENDKQNLLRELNVYQSKKETHKTFDVICSKTTT
uniref:Uncharacterized protein n=1 Tax=Clytia hemisphaerica TaxID=252671 RepID=A0A7M5VFM6_9CNID